MNIAFIGVVFAVATLIALTLIREWMRRSALRVPDALAETRWIDVGTSNRGQQRRRWRRRPDPRHATAAYVALVDDLATYDDLRRDAAETPLEHAARLRSGGRGALSLDLLAADYALARFGQQTLSDAEDRRAVTRWRNLRRHLPRRPS